MSVLHTLYGITPHWNHWVSAHPDKVNLALTEPIITPFCYWILENKNSGDKAPLIKAFCRWLEEETKICPM